MTPPSELAFRPTLLHPPHGAPVEGAARWREVPVVRRAVAAGSLAVLGLGLAIPAVMLPPHGVVSALILGVAGLGAWVLWSRAAFVDALTFTCACGAPVHLEQVGVWTEDTWVRCPACAAPWRVGARR